MMKALFDLGTHLSATPGAILALRGSGVTVAQLFARHLALEPGELCRGDRAANRRALETGERLLSCYVVEGRRLYVITEAADEDGVRYGTTLLCVEEY